MSVIVQRVDQALDQSTVPLGNTHQPNCHEDAHAAMSSPPAHPGNRYRRRQTFRTKSSTCSPRRASSLREERKTMIRQAPTTASLGVTIPTRPRQRQSAMARIPLFPFERVFRRYFSSSCSSSKVEQFCVDQLCNWGNQHRDRCEQLELEDGFIVGA